jgi:hypothetical protein
MNRGNQTTTKKNKMKKKNNNCSKATFDKSQKERIFVIALRIVAAAPIRKDETILMARICRSMTNDDDDNNKQDNKNVGQ